MFDFGLGGFPKEKQDRSSPAESILFNVVLKDVKLDYVQKMSSTEKS